MDRHAPGFMKATRMATMASRPGSRQIMPGFPDVLFGVLAIEDTDQGLVGEKLGGLVDEILPSIGDADDLLARQDALGRGRGVQLGPETFSVVEGRDVPLFEKHSAPR